MSSKKYYLVTNWESGYKVGVKFTTQGIQIDTKDIDTVITSTAPSNVLQITNTGYKIAIYNPTSSSQSTILKGTYDALDFNQPYRIIVNSVPSSDEGTNKSNLKYESPTVKGLYDFTTTDNYIPLTIPANTTWYLYATDGQYLNTDRFLYKRVPTVSTAYYITEMFKYNKLEDVTKFFLPLIQCDNLTDLTKSVNVDTYIASSDSNSVDFSASNITWYPIQKAPSIVTRAKPYFAFKIILPTDKISAISKVGYSIYTDMSYNEPVALQVSVSDVEQTVYRPSIKVMIGNTDVTRFVDSIQQSSVTLNLRKVEENRSTFYLQTLTVYLDNLIVTSGKVTGISKKEYPNAVSYTIKFTTYRELLGSNYTDNTFAFNTSASEITTTPFATEFEFINYIVNYSPANNGIILNSDKFTQLRSLKFWTDDFDVINQKGGMGFVNSPDKWLHFYTATQKLGLETINAVANANRLFADVTHTGSVILSDLIPYDDCTLQFDNTLYDKDITSLLSKCTHRYHDYQSIDTNGKVLHQYIPDHRLYVPEVDYDITQAASVVRVVGTSGVNQATTTPIADYVGIIKGFDTGQTSYVQPGDELNFKTELTVREPSDTFRLAFFQKNNTTGTLEQTVLRGTPTIEGWQNVTYESDKGGLFQPSIQSSPAGLKTSTEWISEPLTYSAGEADDVYGVKFAKITISTDDLKDEPVRQGFLGGLAGFVIALAAVAICIAFPGAIPLIGSIATATAGATGVIGAIGIGGVLAVGTIGGAALGMLNGEFVSKINVNLPLKIKGVSAIRAHQQVTDAPLIGLPDPQWFPKWAKGAYQEALSAKDNLGIEPKSVDNPYVVSMDQYKQPIRSDYKTDKEYTDAVKYSPYHRYSHDIVASGLTLREWMKSRQVQLQYAGNPNWYPNQFIAIAKPSDIGIVQEYAYFYTMGPQSTSIAVGGEVSSSIQAAYVGSSNGSTDIRLLELLNNKLI